MGTIGAPTPAAPPSIGGLTALKAAILKAECPTGMGTRIAPGDNPTPTAGEMPTAVGESPMGEGGIPMGDGGIPPICGGAREFAGWEGGTDDCCITLSICCW